MPAHFHSQEYMISAASPVPLQDAQLLLCRGLLGEQLTERLLDSDCSVRQMVPAWFPDGAARHWPTYRAMARRLQVEPQSWARLEPVIMDGIPLRDL
jgi:hypothetical protein